MDYLKKLGVLPLASRLKRLCDRLYQSGEEVYGVQDLNFNPRWFTLVSRLAEADDEAMSVTVLARELKITHPAVIKRAREMESEGLVESCADRRDARKRLIRLSNKGKDLVTRLEPVWDAFEAATWELFQETGVNLFDVIDKFELAFDDREMSARIMTHLREQKSNQVEIVKFQPKWAEDFKKINYKWLEEYFEIEPYDEIQLLNPQREIIDKGGEIILARLGGQIVGTSALLRIDESQYQLAKMAVVPEHRGNQIGTKLLLSAIELAESKSANRIFLETHPKQKAAIHLYRKHGFRIQQIMSPFHERVVRAADGLVMVLDLKEVNND